MRPIVTHRGVAFAGLLGLGLIAVLMLQGALGIVGAAQRAGVLLVVVLVVERAVLPVARALVGEQATPPAPVAVRGDEDEPQDAPPPSP